MIDSEELVQLILQLINENKENNYKLATVISLFDNKTAKIQFDGEDTPSEKQYSYLDSYTPKVADRVLLASTDGTYAVLGKVNYNISPSTEEEVDRYIFDLKTVSVLKGMQVSGAASFNNGTVTFNNGMTVTGNVGVNGTITATGLSSSGNITASGTLSGGNINTSGTLGAGSTILSSLDVTSSTTLNGLTVNGNLYVKKTLFADSGFIHKGGLSFFGQGSLNSKQSVGQLTGTATLDSIYNKLNALIRALQNYGLIS
ncbi:hypothetical protein [Tissierella sp.]|uniref:hypothetical protein n=1 Tax=Tissierella sp. TaxID=41274 RepID=UPI00304D4CED